jgi:hypothetical protein
MALIAPRIGARIRLFVFDGEADALKPIGGFGWRLCVCATGFGGL